MIFPKKEILFAPMLGTLGGGSMRSFGRGTGGGVDPNADLNFPVGYYNNSFGSANNAWFSCGTYGYPAVDTGSYYKFTAGQDISRQNLRYKSFSNSNSFMICVWKDVAVAHGGYHYELHYMFRVDNSSSDGTAVTFDIGNSPYKVGNPIIPATGDYYLGWVSGVPSGVGNGSFGSMYVDSSSSIQAGDSAIHYASPLGNAYVSIGDVHYMSSYNQGQWMSVRIQN
jgi:hypothetical protein